MNRLLKLSSCSLLFIITTLLFEFPIYCQGNLNKAASNKFNLSIRISDLLINDNDTLLPHELFKEKSMKLFNKKSSQIQYSSSSLIWCRINVTKNNALKYLVIYCPNISKIQVFYSVPNQNKEDSITISPVELKTNRYRSNYSFVQIPISSADILIKIKIANYSGLDFNLYDENSFFKNQRFYDIFYGLSLGTFTLLILYHLILYFKVKENLYLFFLALIINSTFFSTYYQLFTFPSIPLFKDLIYCLFQISAISLCIAFLNLKKRYNWAFKTLLVFLPFLTLFRILNIISPSIFVCALIHVVSILLYSAIIYISVIYSIENHKSGKIFTFSWIILLIGQVLFSIYTFQLVKNNEIGRYALEIGILMNVIFLTLAFGNKLNFYKNEKNIAETNELKALLERDKIIQEQNKILETLISERNKEIIDKINLLANQKQEIENQNMQIKSSNDELNLINEKLSQKNDEIYIQNNELQKQNHELEETINKRTEKLLQEKEKAIVAEKLKTSFLNNLDKEINTPMNSITGFAMLLNDSGLTKEKRNEYLSIINYNVDVLLESIDNMVLLARIQANAIKPKFTNFELNSLFNKYKDYFAEKNFNQLSFGLKLFINSQHSDRSINIQTDYDKIWQIITKLTNFAIKNNSVGEVSLVYELTQIITINNSTKQNLDIIIKFIGFESNQNDSSLIYFKYNTMNDFGIDIAKGLIELLNGNIEIITIDEGIIFKSKIPVQLVGASA